MSQKHAKARRKAMREITKAEPNTQSQMMAAEFIKILREEKMSVGDAQNALSRLIATAVQMDRGRRPTLPADYIQTTEWGPWVEGSLPPGAENLLGQKGRKGNLPYAIKMNDLYEVWLTAVPGDQWPDMIWLSIKRRNKESIHDWRHLQRIKNELVGHENEAVELYPAESRLVDSANQYHLFVLRDPTIKFPFGYNSREILGESRDGAVQRPFAQGFAPKEKNEDRQP